MAIAVCPTCGDPDSLNTIETVTGFSSAMCSVDEEGNEQVENNGSTDMDWDGSRTVGVHCKECWWNYTGEDWFTQLFVLPSLSSQLYAFLAAIDGGSEPDQDPKDLFTLLKTAVSPQAAAQDGRVAALKVLIAADLRDGPKVGNDIVRLYNEVYDNAATAATVAAHP